MSDLENLGLDEKAKVLGALSVLHASGESGVFLDDLSDDQVCGVNYLRGKGRVYCTRKGDRSMYSLGPSGEKLLASI